MAKNKIELKPCPFCGCPASLGVERKLDGGKMYDVIRVQCWSCCARTNDFIIGGYYGLNATPEQVAEAWNRRATTKQESDCPTCGNYPTCHHNHGAHGVVRINCPLWRPR